MNEEWESVYLKYWRKGYELLGTFYVIHDDLLSEECIKELKQLVDEYNKATFTKNDRHTRLINIMGALGWQPWASEDSGYWFKRRVQ